ncbi:unnamed protein product [Paramecium pentaurelia]|uniref:Uncharacterized protein n=1 Tax=Paramecium pentaurelia TaxID=43138 RepID=A0A8S1VHP8_9CILI|nr:unnamed protein product [Paramecium pentaurelia]
MIIDNYFLQLQLITQIQSIQSIIEIQMKNLYVKNNHLTNFSLFSTQQKQLFNNIDFLLLNFNFEDNTPSCQDENILITINCVTLIIKNVLLKNTTNYRFFNLLDIPSIHIDNLVYENLLQEYKVPYQIDCLKICIPQTQLLQIFGFNKVIIQNLQVKSQFSVDFTLISIYSNPLNTSNQNEFIQIKNSIIKGNILLKQNLGILFSLMEFYSKSSLNIAITNLTFEENIFHQYLTDPSQTQASLMYFDTKQSIIIMKNILCIYNSMTNSSQSFFSISSEEVLLENITVLNHNWLNKELWIKYYDILFQGEYNENEISYAIQQSYKIQNVGGIFSMFVTKFTINKGFFSYIQAESNLIFNINLQGEGIGIIRNCSIIHAQNSLISIYENDGAITINGRKSLLKIILENITLEHVYNRLSSSIFSIYPSLKQNNMKFKNIIVKNCFSLVNSIINFQSEFQNADKNKIYLENLYIVQNEQSLLIFLHSIGKISSLELQKVIDDNAMMNFFGCQIQLIGLRIEGIILSPIIKIRDSNSIKLGNLQLVYISTFYTLNLIDIQQNNILQSTMAINNIIIKNLIDFNYQNLTKNLTFYMQDHINVKFVLCKLNNQQILQQIKKQEFVDKFFDEIISKSNQTGSLIRIKSITNLTRALLTKIIIFNNICNHCWNGLLYFDIINVEKIKVSELYCMKNKIKQYGCIAAKSNDNLDGKILIDQSTFISNDGSLGSGIYVENLRILLSNSNIIKNTASQKGGGIYLEQSDYNFKISSTAICNNQADEAGGLYLSVNNRLNQNNFIQSLLILNQAQQFSNNLNESPSRLSLFLNHIEMVSKYETIEHHPVQLLILKPYKIISQNRQIHAQFLFVPSGQQISKYQLYNPKLLNYQSYIHDLRILFKNSLNEQQNNFLNTSCNIIQQVFDIQAQSVMESTQISKINFENETKSFNLGFLDFIIDPFEQDKKIQEILINCKTNYYDESLAYLMRVKAFLCQLGEFYISSSCQQCQSEQGFYSVTYNTTKCSIFDKNKFEAITSNKILLKIGYWRPNQASDDVELCYKNQYLCQGGWGVSNELCFKGHLGGLCEEQEMDNSLKINNLQNDTTKRLIAFFLISIWAILSTLLTIGSIEKSNILFAQLKLRQKFAHILFKLNQDHESILFKLFLNYLWIFSLIFTFNIKLTISLGIFKQSNDTSYFMTNFFECFLSEIQEIELYYSRIIVMLVLMLCQILVIFIGFKIVSIIKNTKFKSLIISITILQMYVQNYASLLNQFFSILVVRQISNINYISGDVSLLYGSKSHISWIYGFSIPGSCFIGLILPLLIFLILYINRDQHDKIKFRRHLGYLFNEYTQNCYFWEIIKLWKKTIIILILIYFQTDIFFKAQLLSLCLLFYQLIAYKYQPYILKKLNQLDNQSVQLCLIAIFLAVLKYISEQKGNDNISAIMQTFIIVNSIILSYPFIMNILNTYILKHKVKVISLLINMFSACKPNFAITKFLRNRLNKWRQKEEKAKQNIGKIRKIQFKQNNIFRKLVQLNEQKNQYGQLTVQTNFDKDI